MWLKIALLCTVIYTVCGLHPDTGKNIFEMVTGHGYEIEAHNVTTEDGYILQMHRISRANIDNTRPPVLVMHGLLSSSADWVNLGPENAFAYLLVEQGYDVWLGNVRGTTWSRKHLTLNPDEDAKYWDFSWNEMGVYDLPAKIDYILEETKMEKLFYVGHSQGTTVFFVMASEKPEYSDKLIMMSALGPAIFLDDMTNPFVQALAPKEQQLTQWAIDNEIGEFLPSTEMIEQFGKTFCNENSPIEQMCENLIFLICGFDSQQLNDTLIPVITTNAPAGSSVKQFLHFLQNINVGGFRKFDYHSAEVNIEKYGQATPPEYPLERITIPIDIYHGKNDWLVSPTDVDELGTKLSTLINAKLIEYEYFNHIDYIWAMDVKTMLYDDVLAEMAKH